MPFIPDPIFQTNQPQPAKTGFQPLATTTPGFIPDSNAGIPNPSTGPSLIDTIGKSSLNPVRDLTAGATGQVLRLSPSFRGADQANQQAVRLNTMAANKGISPTPVGDTPDQILNSAGANPNAKQVAGSALSTASLFIPGGSGWIARFGSDALQGFGIAAGSALQDNQSPSDAAQSGLWGALFNMGLGIGSKAVSLAWKGLTSSLPEKLYSPTFRQTADDVLSRARQEAKGVPTKTLARSALESGVKLDSKGLVGVIKTLNDTETQLRSVVAGKGKFIDIGDREPYIKFLQQVKATYEGGFMSDKAAQADAFIKQLKGSRLAGGSGNIPAETALDLKRFMDHMRNTSSFRLDPMLNAKQEQFKAGADLLRTALKKQLPEAADLLGTEQKYIQFADALATEAAKRSNAQIFNLFDAIVGGESIGAGFPFSGIGLDAALRTAQQPFFRGKMAQTLFKAGQVAGSTPAAVGEIAAPIGRTLSGEASASMVQPQTPPTF